VSAYGEHACQRTIKMNKSAKEKIEQGRMISHRNASGAPMRDNEPLSGSERQAKGDDRWPCQDNTTEANASDCIRR